MAPKRQRGGCLHSRQRVSRISRGGYQAILQAGLGDCADVGRSRGGRRAEERDLDFSLQLLTQPRCRRPVGDVTYPYGEVL